MINRLNKEIEAIYIYEEQRVDWLYYAATHLKYSDYVIAYDIAFNDKEKIEIDLLTEKITVNKLQRVYNIALEHIDDLPNRLQLDFINKYI